MEPGLKEGAFYDPSNFTFPAGCYICEVEVDPETGKTEIVQFVAADDFGNIINPMIVEGQVHGGMAQGIGQALLEGTPTIAETGQLLTASYMDYTMPRADDLPSLPVSNTVTACPATRLASRAAARPAPSVLRRPDQRDHRCDRQQQPDHACDPGAGLGPHRGRNDPCGSRELVGDRVGLPRPRPPCRSYR
jgi:carbon-monoxide dehydrogenase large subunit